MAIPRSLKGFALFVDGRGYVGKVSEIELPEMSSKSETFRGGGMDAEIELDMGLEAMTCTWTMMEYNEDQLAVALQLAGDGVDVTVRGGLQAENTATTPVEVRMRGRVKKLELGTLKAGEKSEPKFELTCQYFRYVQAGRELIEIDCINHVRRINGVDQMAEMNVALGLVPGRI